MLFGVLTEKLVFFNKQLRVFIVSLMSHLWIRNLPLKLVAEPIYCLPQHLHAIR